MTNTVFVLFSAFVVFAFGYRFFSKFLVAWVFRSNVDYSTPAPQVADSSDRLSSARYMPLIQRISSLAAAVPIIGVTMAMAWGWIPIFLWAICGSVVAAGTYAMGSLWLAQQCRRATAAGQTHNVTGNRGTIPILALVAALSVLVNALMLLVMTKTLTAYPASTIPFLLFGGIALALGVLVHRYTNLGIPPAALIALATGLLALWACRDTPLQFIGQLQLQITATRTLTLDARVAWIVIASALAWYITRQPRWRFALPYGLLSTALLGTLLLILFAAIVVAHPVLTAPAFHRPHGGQAVLPWLFVTVTSGAIGGWQALVAVDYTPRRPGAEAGIQRLGYGGAIADALIALGAILASSAAFSGHKAWLGTYAQWNNVTQLGQILQIYIRGITVLGRDLGLNPAFASTLGTVTLACLSMATLVGALGMQRQALEELEHSGALPGKVKNRIVAAGLVLAAGLATQASWGHALAYWPLFGSAGISTAAALLAVMVLALARRRLPLLPVLTVLVFVLATGVWAIILELAEFWAHHQWTALGVCLVLAFTLAVALWRTAAAVSQSLRERHS